MTIPGGSPITIVGGSYNSGTGVLGLTGSATKLQYENVLKTLTYANSDDDPDATARLGHRHGQRRHGRTRTRPPRR